ncbi:MAG: 2,3-bisphosphoglycerate-independent phosphoglycerate mutase [Actinobacteria bacterium]|nr:2,3-bisphosphoglycerate-independent phosphoglycerate mutase [Actinomycetota bacterium]MBM3697188.1 2,3-bisphosphoglycerate-independent phosphoglycerate mutase [Actinomycetota bacterium]
MSGPLVLVVIDGFGVAPPGPGNAVTLARTPALDALAAEGSATLLQASGLPVGLPEGQMGNSEVGHLNLGAGRRVPQMLVRIDEAVAAPGGLAQVPAIAAALANGRGSTLHLVGLVGDGGVHASQRHLIALLDAARAEGVDRVVVHAITDGRDSRPDSALPAIRDLEGSGARVGTVVGRYWAMDRDHRWDRTQRAYDAMVAGRGEAAATASDAVQRSYESGVTDEFIEPWVIGDPADGRIRPGDQVIVWNFRPDRARQITQALGDPAFDGFDRGAEPPMPAISTMTRLRREWDYPVAFEAEDVRQGLAESVSDAGRSQLHVAETEKYAHVTYFFNGGREDPFDGEDRLLVQSPQHVATYDEAPEMSAMGIRDAVVGALGEGGRDFIVVNFANADMVGHTGVVPAAVRGIEAVDRCMADIRPAVAAAGGLLIVTADHGNSEVMIEPDGTANTAHTTNPVPLWIDRPGLPLREGRLGDVAPTACALLGWDAPPAMTGDVLLDPAD